MAALYRYYSGRSPHPSQPTDAGQGNNNGEAADVPLVEEDPAAGIQEGAVMEVEIQLQEAEELEAGVQEDIAMAIHMRLDRILRKTPHTRTPLERLAVLKWVEQRDQL